MDPVWPETMFTKQVCHSMDSPHPPSWPRRRSRSSNSKNDLVTGPDPRFFCPSGSRHGRGETWSQKRGARGTEWDKELPQGSATMTEVPDGPVRVPNPGESAL